MVKDNKFAAEPSADGTADAKVDHSEAKITTTENVIQPEDTKEVQKDVKSVKGSDEQKWYVAYVKGNSIQAIADEFKVDTQEVIEAIQARESKRGK